ncbi:MAG: 2-oxoacid:acceptor oxidoreductase family protein [Spirochaetaceae bacterium]|nr:2-oxoacid:acceptor oxidoreductase family protein [Spirochaetaceae bacterium]
MIQRFVFSGTGGQGVITAAIVLAEAALYYGELNAVQTQVYGPEARGGAARSDVIIADSEIWFPRVLEPNVAVCLGRQAYARFSGVVRPGGIIIVDPYTVRIHKSISSRQFQLPFHETVMTEYGTSQALNMCMLGALVRLIPIVSPDAMRQVISDRFDERFRETNLSAFELGCNLVKESVRTF